MTGSHRDEIAKLEALYSANPEGRIFTHLAEAYRKGGELARARETIERGLERHGDYSSAHVVRGRILIDLGERGEAEHAFQRVLALDPENRIALWTLGDLAREAGRRADALGFYQELLLLDPTDEAAEALVRSLDYELSAARGAEAAPEPAADAEPAASEGEGAEHWAGSNARDDEPFQLEPLDFEPLDFAPLDFEPLAEESLAEESLVEESLAEESLVEEPLIEEPAALDPLDLELGSLDFDAFDLGAAMLEPELASPGDAAAPEPDPELGGGDLYGFEEFAAEFDGAAVEGSELPWGGAEQSVEWGNEEPTAAWGVADVALDEGETAEPEPAFEAAEDASAHEVGPVVTETLAELYASQELYDRAAEIYRELLRIRPGDPRLLARLEALDAAAHPAVEASEPVTLARSGRTIGQYLGGLLAFVGTEAVEEGAPGVDAFAADHAEAPEAEPVDALPLLEPAPAEEVPAAEAAPLGVAPVAEEAPVAEIPEAEIAASVADVLESTAEVPESEAEIAEPLTEVTEPAAGIFYLDESMVVVEADAAVEEVLYLDESMVVAEAGAGAAGDEFDRLFAGQGELEDEPPAQSPVAVAGEGDDDDLEMFRSWLQNLKRS